MKAFNFFIALCCLVLTAKAQTVYDVISDPTKNYYDVVNYYTEYFKTHETGKGSGYKMFKRWETEMKYWIDEKGNRIAPAHYITELNKFNSRSVNKTSSSACVANWAELGPTYWNRTSSWAPGLGRIDAVAIHPLNSNVIYAGSPQGGCWKTTNGGTNWISLTDGQLFMQIGDVEVDPTNLNTVYIGTMGSGMLVSTDGGTTLTSSNSGLPGGINIRKIIVNPTNPAIVLIATNNGIYRSINSGGNWTLTSAGSFYDMDFQPGNPSVVYACGNNFYRSTNGGVSFTQITSGISVSDVMRLAVSPANPNLVCIVQCAGSLFGRFYKSVNGGTSFTTTVIGDPANGTNFFGYSPAGTDNKGQGGYNIDVTISPMDANEVHIAGIITWKSGDGGTNWVSTTEWTYPNTRGYTHCDVHTLEYFGNKLFVGSDGGLSVSTDMGDNFTPISNGLGIRMFYRLGCAKTNSITIATGAQDNGGSVRTATGWIDWIGADGMETAVDPTNANIIYGSSQNGSFYKTTNGGTSYSGLTTPSTNGKWTTPFVIDPNTNTTLYVGYDELHKSTNSGVNWTQISSIAIGKLDHIAVAPSNSNYIYISSGNKIYRTTDGGTTWTNIATGLGGLTINDIAVHNSSPDKVAFATSSSKIYTSTNGGTAWTNSTGNFPAVSARCLVYQNDASEGLYVGTNTGVYYKDNTMINWISFATGLPKVGVNELEIHYASNKIRAATYGRGVWESDICIAPTAAPSANFVTSVTSACTTSSVQLTDMSTNSPSSWSWSVTASTGVAVSSSTVQNPSVTFANAGTYTISLTVGNSIGSGTTTKTITVGTTPTLTANNATVCSGQAVVLTASGATTYSWNTGATTSTILVSPATTTNYMVTGTTTGCSNKKTVSVSVNATPTVAANNATLCSVQPVVLTASGATTYSWNTGATTPTISVSPTTETNYTVTGTTSGCSEVKIATVTVNTPITPTMSPISGPLCVNSDTVALSATPAGGAFSGLGVSGSTFDPSASGSGTIAITYSYIDGNNCSGSDVEYITVNLCTGITELGGTSLSVYPNPAKDKLIIQLDESYTDVTTIELYDAIGKLVIEEKMKTQMTSLNVSKLAKGIYSVRVTSANHKAAVIRIIKE